jgi:hypothetical protein
VRFDRAGYTESLSDNLFAPLSVFTEEESRSGDGAELGRPGERGKMQALHSSSALACNFFDYWRGRDTHALASALSLPVPIVKIAFEQKFPTGLRGKAPNLDVVLRPLSGSLIAIESKFLEPYGTAGAKPGFKAKYFESNQGLWQGAGYPHCQELAKALYSRDHAFKWLNAEQLLKHILGLARGGGQWTLLYLWYQVPGTATGEHAAEAEQFGSVATSDGIEFKALSYQTLFQDLRRHVEARDREYMDYLRNRYFATMV